MSQPAAAGPPAATAPAPSPPTPSHHPTGRAAVTPASPATAPARAAAPGQQVSLTPRRLRQWMLVVVAGGLLFGVLGLISYGLQAQAMIRADANTAQLIRVQTIQTDLLTADATVSNAFLVGGLEPAEQRQRYDRAIEAVNRLIAEAAQAQPADAEALAALNTRVSEYAVTIEQARANNRQGFPVGAQYLREAGAALRADALPILDNLVAANTARAEQEMAARHPLTFQIAAVVILIAFVLGMVWIARRFKRTINVGLLAGTLSLLLAVIVSGVILTAAGGAVRDLRAGSFATVTALAQARIEAGDAKANESLTLIARGSGAAYEDAWQESADEVMAQLEQVDFQELQTGWQNYVAQHEKIRELDDSGRWDDAVALAHTETAFANFDRALADRLAAAAEQTTSALGGPRAALITGAILIFAGGVAAAVLGRWGVAVRLREYR